MTHFTLTVATSRDGFISRSTDEPPQIWASAEEQDLFFRDVQTADWAIMGRNTHLAADRPDRRRIIFSSKIKGWQRATQLWMDPDTVELHELASLVGMVHPLENALILGGTRVHDWFLKHRAIDTVHLTIEPVSFGAGLLIFTAQTSQDPVEVFKNVGFAISSDDMLNKAGTRYLELVRST